MSVYHRITFREREEISIRRVSGKSIRTIANELNRSPSTISREIARNKSENNSYRAVVAQCWVNNRLKKPKKKRKLDTNKRLRGFVIDHLKKYWSPEQIAISLEKMYPEDMTMRVSHETIYSYLYVKPRGALKEMLIMQLRQNRLRRRKKHKRVIRKLRDMALIDERPPEVNHRIIPGHWEGDLIIGSTYSAIGTLVERTTRMALLAKVSGKDADVVRKAFVRAFKRIPSDLKKSLTYDQGSEMAQHTLFTKQSNIKVYFAHPHSPWERGTNENTNGLLRQFFPKGINFDKVSNYQIRRAQQLLNERPRKTLNWLSPYEAWQKTVALGT